MEDIHTALSGVLLRCSPLCIEALLKKWDKLPKECIRKVDFDAKKTSLVLQISELSEQCGFQIEDFAQLDLLRVQMDIGQKKKWAAYKMNGDRSKLSIDHSKLIEQINSVMKTGGFEKLTKLVAWSMFGGGHWIRVHLTHWLDDHILRETVYVVWYPHTPILFVLGRVKARTRLALFDALLKTFDCDEIVQLCLTGYHLPSLVHLALHGMAQAACGGIGLVEACQRFQGPLQRFRELHVTENPLVRSLPVAKRLSQELDHTHSGLVDDRHIEKKKRTKIVDNTFGTGVQPTLDTLQYKFDLHFCGNISPVDWMYGNDLFHCKVKFEGSSVLEGIKNFCKMGYSDVSLPRHMSQVSRSGTNHLTIDEMDNCK